jgi:predicted Zn-dependent peptidase
MKQLRITLFLVAMMLANVLLAQPKHEWKTATAAGYTYRYVSNDPMQARFYKLKNGLTVILSVNKKEPRIYCFVSTNAGSTSDPRTNTGLAHYLEHLLFKGTDKYGSLDWAKEKPLLDQIDKLYEKYNKTTDTTARKAIYKEIDQVSGQAAKFAIANEYDKMMAGMGAQGTNAFTNNDQTSYVDDIPSNAIDRYLAVQAERFRNPVLRIFHTELEAVYEEKNRSLDEDGWKSFEVMFDALFPTHNYGQQTTIGTIEHLKNPSLIEIRNYYNKFYVPNNMCVVMAGDLDPDVTIKKIEEKLGYMQPKPVAAYSPAPEAPITSPIVREVIGPKPENIQIAYRLPGAADTKNAVLLTVADEIMSNSAAGLIDLDLNKKQLILRGGSSPNKMKDYSVWTLNGRPKKDQSLDEVKNLLLGEVEKLKKGEFDGGLIPAIVNNYKRNYIQELENNYSRANPLLTSFVESKGEGWLNDVSKLDDMLKVSKADVVAFANQFFQNNYVVLYKRKGEDKSIKKVQKPAITQVETNRESQSPFLQNISKMDMVSIKPTWLDFARDVKKGRAGAAEILYVQNTQNDLFRMSYRFPKMGKYYNKLLSLATEYVKFLATDKLSSEQISQEFYKLACSFQVYAGDENSLVYLNGLQDNMPKAAALLEQLMLNCKADETALEELKGRIIKQRADNKLQKGAIMQGLMNYAQYGAKNPFNNQLTNDELKAVKSADLITLLHNLFKTEHQIVYYGPLNLSALTMTILKLHKIPAKFDSDGEMKKYVQVIQDKNTVLFADYDMVQSEISWIRNTAQFNPAVQPTVELFNNYFGGGMASIVFQTLRESKALAYSTYAYYGTPSKKGQKYSLTGYIGSQADKFNEAIAGMNELLTELPKSENLLQTAKLNMKKTYDTERILQDNIIYTYLDAQDKGMQTDIRKQVYEQLDKITFDDVKRFHAENIANKPYTYCVVASEKRVTETDLKKYGELKKLTLEEIFGY